MPHGEGRCSNLSWNSEGSTQCTSEARKFSPSSKPFEASAKAMLMVNCPITAGGVFSCAIRLRNYRGTEQPSRPRRLNGLVKTASQRSRLRVGIHWRAINIAREKAKDRYLQLPRSFVILGTATLIATHFSAEVAAYVTRSTGHEVLHIAEQASRSANQGSRKSNLVAQRQAEADQASGPRKRSKLRRCSRSRRCPCRKRHNP